MLAAALGLALSSAAFFSRFKIDEAFVIGRVWECTSRASQSASLIFHSHLLTPSELSEFGKFDFNALPSTAGTKKPRRNYYIFPFPRFIDQFLVTISYSKLV